MGVYISQSDLERRWGTANVRQWSNLDNTTVTANTANITAAIEWAESEIDNMFRASKFVVPIQPGGSRTTLVGWCTAFAGFHLYGARGLRDQDVLGGKIRFEFDTANETISRVLAGQVLPDFAEKRTNDPTAPSVVGA